MNVISPTKAAANKRNAKLGGVKLFPRTCAKTGKPIESTYGPETPFPVWDREEYNRKFRG